MLGIIVKCIVALWVVLATVLYVKSMGKEEFKESIQRVSEHCHMPVDLAYIITYIIVVVAFPLLIVFVTDEED